MLLIFLHHLLQDCNTKQCQYEEYVQPIVSYPLKKGCDLMEAQRETKVFEYSNAIVTVHFPDITAEERKRRMKLLHKAAEDLLKERIKNETHTG